MSSLFYAHYRSSLSARQLASGASMPLIHLGLYLTSGNETSQAVLWGLESGYRGFDSAQMYGNERATGKAIMKFLESQSNTAKLRREDIHYTSKLSSNGYRHPSPGTRHVEADGIAAPMIRHVGPSRNR